jgi:hypothetical protein
MPSICKVADAAHTLCNACSLASLLHLLLATPAPAAGHEARSLHCPPHHTIQQPLPCTPMEVALALLPLLRHAASVAATCFAAAAALAVLCDAALHAALVPARLAAGALHSQAAQTRAACWLPVLTQADTCLRLQEEVHKKGCTSKQGPCGNCMQYFQAGDTRLARWTDRSQVILLLHPLNP